MLVSTRVIEVGVDVPNACVMVDRVARAIRPGAAAPTARPRRPRHARRLLRRVVGEELVRASPRAARCVRRDDRRLRAGRDRFPAPRPGRPVRHAAARPAAAADRRSAPRSGDSWKKPAARPSGWSPPIRASHVPSTPGSAARCSPATARRWNWATWASTPMVDYRPFTAPVGQVAGTAAEPKPPKHGCFVGILILGQTGAVCDATTTTRRWDTSFGF